VARLGVYRPKKLSARYESIAGDLNERRTRYLFKRHLGIEPEDAGALPWWKRKLYVEGLLWEFADQDAPEVNDGSLDDLQGQGFTVNSV
jgi:hypothetical protein